MRPDHEHCAGARAANFNVMRTCGHVSYMHDCTTAVQANWQCYGLALVLYIFIIGAAVAI